ncbi:hypothetical protein [Pricia sp.]|uniref:hypothetical protein n=1 Tax=Pricia sp. TaxID=2268138 RepID=UPI0035941FEE
MLIEVKVYSNLHLEMVQHHKDKGLRQSIVQLSQKQFSVQRSRLLRKDVYAISSLLGGDGKKTEEVYNGFKDEFTDWSKFKKKRKGIRY